MTRPGARCGAEIRQRRDAAGLTQGELAARIGYASGHSMISKAENGHELSRPVAMALDHTLGADGSILRLWAEEWLGRQATKVGIGGLDSPAPDGALLSIGQTEEADTDRREFLRAGGSLATGAMAAELSDRIARADPTPLKLREIGMDLRRISESYNSTARDLLVPHVEAGWIGVEKLLDTRVSAKIRPQLAAHAGWYSYYLATLGFDLGDDAGTASHLSIASQHADEAEDPLLTGVVAYLESAVAFYNKQYALAFEVADRARPGADPSVRASLASYQAAGAALTRRPDAARAALDDMQAHVLVDVDPGPFGVDEANAHKSIALTLADLGDGLAAESHARRALDLFADTGQFGEIGGSHNALARAFLRRKHPEPEQAASAAQDALRAVDGQPVRWVIQTSGQLWRDMARWGSLPAVRDLGEMVSVSRSALSAGSAA